MTDFFDALLFPQAIHERRPDPGPFTDYRSYKPYLQQEFRRKCVYCRVSDGLKGFEGFGVDHYHPKSRTDAPTLPNSWWNLFYACNVCNTWKGRSESTPERFLPNPCAYPPSRGSMAEHLQYQNVDVVIKTSHGAWLSELLHLPERRDFRAFVRSALGQFLAARAELLELLDALEERQREAGSDVEPTQEFQEAVEKLRLANRGIERLTGEPITSEP